MEWFSNWFNSPYYHILYANRNDAEAEQFIDNLIKTLPIKKQSSILDVACGKGRHSIYLHEKGFTVTGIDLSQESITYAQQFSTKGLNFLRADMRNFELPIRYNYILNLFTSFGYFNSQEEDKQVFTQIKTHLIPNGIFVQDYLNANYISQNLVTKETKVLQGVEFNISRKINENFIIKDININDKGKLLNFSEKVKIYTLQDFNQLAQQSGFKITQVFGNYNLATFDEATSPRLILTYQLI